MLTGCGFYVVVSCGCHSGDYGCGWWSGHGGGCG